MVRQRTVIHGMEQAKPSEIRPITTAWTPKEILTTTPATNTAVTETFEETSSLGSFPRF
ncbi:hypothetical protein D3C73_1572140 [compost metagenome]